MPSILALIILLLFVVVVMHTVVKTGTLDADFKQTLFAIVMVAVGFYLGSSSDSRKKTEMLTAPTPMAAALVSGETMAPAPAPAPVPPAAS
jgi:hypothetical protein